MSFLSKLFKKKPGGTTVGNLLRGVSNVVTNGALGQGNNMIPLPAEVPAVVDTNNTGVLPEVKITAPPKEEKEPIFNPKPKKGESYFNIQKLVSPYQMEVKADNSQLMMLGGLAAFGLLIYAMNKK